MQVNMSQAANVIDGAYGDGIARLSPEILI
jgi:hypothetical protein